MKKTLPTLFAIFVLENNGTINYESFKNDSRFKELVTTHEDSDLRTWYENLLSSFRVDINMLIREADYEPKKIKHLITNTYGVTRVSLRQLEANIDDIWLTPYPELASYEFFKEHFLKNNCYVQDYSTLTPREALEGYELYLKQHKMGAFKAVFTASYLRNITRLTDELRDHVYLSNTSMSDLAKKYHKDFRDMTFIVTYLGSDRLPSFSLDNFKRYFLHSPKMTPEKIIEKNPLWKDAFYAAYDSEINKVKQLYFDTTKYHKSMTLDAYMSFLQLSYPNTYFLTEVRALLKEPKTLQNETIQYFNYIIRHPLFSVERFGAKFGLSHSLDEVYSQIVARIKETAENIQTQKGFVTAHDLKQKLGISCSPMEIKTFCEVHSVFLQHKETLAKDPQTIFKSVFLKYFPAEYKTLLPHINKLHERNILPVLSAEDFESYYRQHLEQLRRDVFDAMSSPGSTLNKVAAALSVTTPHDAFFYLDGLSLLGKKKFTLLTDSQFDSIKQGSHSRLGASAVIDKVLDVRHSADYDTLAQSLKIPAKWANYLLHRTGGELLDAMSKAITADRIKPDFLKTIPDPEKYFRGALALSFNAAMQQFLEPINQKTITAFCKILTPYQVAECFNKVANPDPPITPEAIFWKYKHAFEVAKDTYLDYTTNHAACTQRLGIAKEQVKTLLRFYTNDGVKTYDKLLAAQKKDDLGPLKDFG